MGLGRYILNSGVIGSALGALGVAKQTKQMPRDNRRYLVWLTWAISFVLAIWSVRNADSDAEHIASQKEQAKAEKEAAKAAKKIAKKR